MSTQWPGLQAPDKRFPTTTEWNLSRFLAVVKSMRGIVSVSTKYDREWFDGASDRDKRDAELENEAKL